MGTFRKQNKGKYDFKQMGREAGKAWHKVKGGDKCKTLKGDEQAKCVLEEDAADKEALNFKQRGEADYYGGRRRRTQKRRRR